MTGVGAFSSGTNAFFSLTPLRCLIYKLILFHINSIILTIGSVFPNAAVVNKLDVSFLVIEVNLLANSMTAEKHLSKCKNCYNLDSVSPFVVTVDTPQSCKPKADMAAGDIPPPPPPRF